MSKPDEDPKPTQEGDETFLLRWARRKEAARAGKPHEKERDTVPAAAPAPAADHQVPEGAETKAAAPAAPELPSVETLTDESDFSAFMHAGVSPDLRRQALRKLFRGAKYDTIDPLDPFRADFTDYVPLGDIVTADMKFHAERLLREQLEKVAGQAEGPADSRADSGEEQGDKPEEADSDDERRDA